MKIKELSEIKDEMKGISKQISNLSERVITISNQIANSMDKISNVLQETNQTIRESLILTTDTIQKMSNDFSETLDKTLERMQTMKINMDVRDSLLKSLGLEGILPDFLKKK